MIKSSLAMMAGGALPSNAEPQEPAIRNDNLASSPSTLKIIGMPYAVIVKPGASPCVLVRIETNQGAYGLGEVHDVAGSQYTMVLMSRLVGENPLRIDYLFRRFPSLEGVRDRRVAYAP